MSFFSSILGAAAPVVGGIFGGPAGAAIGGLLGGAVSGGSQQSGSTTATQQQQLDPRMQAILYGDGAAANKGLLSQITGLQGQPQTPGMAGFGGNIDSYMKDYAGQNLPLMQNAATRLTNGAISAPRVDTALAQYGERASAAQANAAGINAPAQNNLNLSGAYDKMINGDAGANPYLTKALQSGVDQTNASYQKNQADLTNNLQRNVLPGIRSNSVLAGQYGGSRQGIAEGNAIGDYTNQLSNSNLQLGLANSANTTGAQAQAFNQGQDRSLAALNNLSGQQYGVAQQNAQMQQQANLANAGFQQAANSQNSSNAQQMNLTNAGFQQQSGLANQQAQMGTNQLNSANTATGAGISAGLLGQAYNMGTANDAYDRTKTGQVAGLLAPFTGLGGSSTSTQPYYTNPVGNALGGAAGALGMYNSYKQVTGGAKSGQLANPGQAPAGYDWGSMLSGYGG